MLDETDLRLLDALQRDAQMSTQALGERVNLSASQVGRRRQRLEAAGYIRGYGARLDENRLGLQVQAFVQVQMASHEAAQVASFARRIDTLPEITGAWILSGEADYLLHIYCRSLTDLNRLIQNEILPLKAVARVQSQIVMDQRKYDGPLPVRCAVAAS